MLRNYFARVFLPLQHVNRISFQRLREVIFAKIDSNDDTTEVDPIIFGDKRVSIFLQRLSKLVASHLEIKRRQEIVSKDFQLNFWMRTFPKTLTILGWLLQKNC